MRTINGNGNTPRSTALTSLGGGQVPAPPKLKNRFQVTFLTDRDVQICPGLPDQILTVSEIVQSKHSGPLDVIMDIKDDEKNLACSDLQILLGTSDFKIKIEHLDDNNTVLRTQLVQLVNLEEIHHGELDYTSSSKMTKRAFFFAGNLVVS